MTTKQSLDKRRDVRSEEQFKKDIKDATLREKKLLDLWIKEMEHLGHNVKAEDNGVNNTGDFIEFSNNNPDYKLTIDNNSPCLYEIKQNPFKHRNSFKIYDLQTYIKLKAKILLFYGISRNGDLTKDSRWAIIEPEAMERMLIFLPSTSGDIKWGYKPIVVVWERLFDEYFKSNEFKSI